MSGFALEPRHKSSSGVAVTVIPHACVPHSSVFLCLLSLLPLHSADHQSQKQLGHFSLSCLTELSLPWPLTPNWNAYGLDASMGPSSPLPVSLPPWHWAARQYFPSVEWRAWHRQLDMGLEPTANQWCTTHFYSTSLWESSEMRSLSARLSTESGIQKQILFPETLNMFYIQARNTVGWNNLRMNLIGSWNVWVSFSFIHQLFSFRWMFTGWETSQCLWCSSGEIWSASKEPTRPFFTEFQFVIGSNGFTWLFSLRRHCIFSFASCVVT